MLSGAFFIPAFSILHFILPCFGEFTDLICEPSPEASSQFTKSTGENTTILNDKEVFDPFPQFAHGLEAQAPEHFFSFIETTREIRTPVNLKEITGMLAPPPQFTGDISFQDIGLQKGEVIWHGGPHVVGEISLNRTEDSGEAQRGFWLPPGAVGSTLTGVSEPTGALATPNKIRRFLKVVRILPSLACVK